MGDGYKRQVREAYAELYDLKKNGQLFADDDYIDVSKYIPVEMCIRDRSITSSTTKAR